jgi:hypothetical protein
MHPSRLFSYIGVPELEGLEWGFIYVGALAVKPFLQVFWVLF